MRDNTWCKDKLNVMPQTHTHTYMDINIKCGQLFGKTHCHTWTSISLSSVCRKLSYERGKGMGWDEEGFLDVMRDTIQHLTYIAMPHTLVRWVNKSYEHYSQVEWSCSFVTTGSSKQFIKWDTNIHTHTHTEIKRYTSLSHNNEYDTTNGASLVADTVPF